MPVIVIVDLLLERGGVDDIVIGREREGLVEPPERVLQEEGQVLEVVSDDEGIKQDMPAWCDTTGHQMVGLEEEQTKSGTIYKTFVKKTK